jgi:hypothetical protein
MKKRWFLYAVVAACLAAASPVIASSIDVVDLESPGLMDWWFVLAPLQIDVLLQAESQYRLWIWMAVYFVEHLLLIVALGWIVKKVSGLRASASVSASHNAA